jgi:phage shock protein PspC (stress-responsive transcriptional regulator)
MAASIIVVFIIFGILFLGIVCYMISLTIRIRKLNDKLEEDNKK